MSRRFPQDLFVKIEEDSGTQYFVADGDIETLAESGETIKIARYRLMEKSEVKLVPQIKRIK